MVSLLSRGSVGSMASALPEVFAALSGGRASKKKRLLFGKRPPVLGRGGEDLSSSADRKDFCIEVWNPGSDLKFKL